MLLYQFIEGEIWKGIKVYHGEKGYRFLVGSARKSCGKYVDVSLDVIGKHSIDTNSRGKVLLKGSFVKIISHDLESNKVQMKYRIDDLGKLAKKDKTALLHMYGWSHIGVRYITWEKKEGDVETVLEVVNKQNPDFNPSSISEIFATDERYIVDGLIKMSVGSEITVYFAWLSNHYKFNILYKSITKGPQIFPAYQ